jgi:zinc and cadmium transporter
MTEAVIYTFFAVLVISLISLIGLFFVPARLVRVQSFLLFLVGVAAGALLGNAFIHLIPEALEELSGLTVGLWILVGLGMFFALEKFLHWHHRHELHVGTRQDCDDCDEHIAPFGKLILFADGLHNVIDGAIIAAGFLISVEAGIAITIAVAIHEIAQEIGDFGVLIHAGFSRMRALLFNFISALMAFVGAIAVLIIGNAFAQFIPIFAAIAAGSFIYIAIADLLPELHKSTQFKQSVIQFFAVVLGVLLMIMLAILE